MTEGSGNVILLIFLTKKMLYFLHSPGFEAGARYIFSHIIYKGNVVRALRRLQPEYLLKKSHMVNDRCLYIVYADRTALKSQVRCRSVNLSLI